MLTTVMKKILIYTPQHAVGMSITLIKELCWVATHYAAENSEPRIDPSEHVLLVSEDGQPVRCFSGNTLSIDMGMRHITDVDAFFIGAFWGQPHAIIKCCDNLVQALPSLHKQGIPIAAVSNAPLLLAAAGLLTDKIATIYPPASEDFSQQFPSVNLHQERAITRSGNLYCANGIASGCDLAVSIIEILYGKQIASRISQEFLLGFNRSYSVANTSFDGQKYHKDSQILKAQQWLERHFDTEISIQSLADSLGMSTRNFSRRFKLATGDSPSHYLQRIRIATAKECLKDSALTISEIAYRVGFADVSHFSRTFTLHEGVQPRSYRESLRLPT